MTNKLRIGSTKPGYGRSLLSAKAAFTAGLLLGLPALTAMADSYWTNSTGTFNNPLSWDSGVVPTAGVSASQNANNDNGSNNVVLIGPNDPVWNPWDIRAGNNANTVGAFLQTGSTNNVGGWFRLAVGGNTVGYYTLSNGVVNANLETHVGETGVGVLEISGGTYNAIGFNLAMGDADFGQSPVGTLNMYGGTINSSSEIWFGEANSGRIGTGYLNMTGGTINANNWFVLGRFGSVGIANMTGGTINKNANGNIQFAVGTTAGPIGAMATFNQSGGTINSLSEYQIGTDNNLARATNNVSGTAVLNVNNWFAVGRFGAYGELNLSGGAITKTGGNGNVTLGSGTGTGIINQTGGTFTNTTSQTWIAENNIGAWNLNGGTAVLGVIRLCQNSGANGTFNLNGGNLTAYEINSASGGNAVFNFNGGVLHASGDNPTFMHDLTVASLAAGGAIIDTAGHDINISQALWDGGGGGLTKNGAGTLTLSGVNSYVGSTVVNAGGLATTTASFANGGFTVADGASLSVTVVAVNGQFSPGSLTLGSAGATTVGIDVGAFGNPAMAPLNVTGTLTANGTITVNVNDALPQLGQFPLIKYGTKAGAGTFVLGTLPVGVVASLVNNTLNGSIDLNITSIAVERWDGSAGGNWDVNVTANWIDLGSNLPTTYKDGTAVIFNDLAAGTNVINLVTNVKPASLTIFNDNTNFALVGNGKIGGGIGLNKQGAAAFTIATTNDFTGKTVLTAGTLIASNLANGGSASAIGASSAAATNLVLAGGTLSYAGPAVSINRGYNLQVNYSSNGLPVASSLDLQNDLSLGGAVTAGINSGFVKSGPGKLTYAGAGTNELSGGGFPGYNILAGTVVFDGSSGVQTNHSQNELWVGASTNTGANLVLSNTTLKVDSWVAVGRGNGSSGNLSTLTLTNSTLYSGSFSLGYWANLSGNLANQVLTLNNSKVFNNGDFNLGENAGSSATLSLNGNSVLTTSGRLLPGMQTGATGIVMMADSSIITNKQWFSCGANGEGHLIMKNNSLWVETSDFNFGDYGAAGTLGTLTIQDNAQVLMTGGSVFVGKTAQSIGLVTQTGGTINARVAGVFQLAQQAGSTGTWLQSAGTNYAGGWVSIGRGATSGDLTPTGLLVVSGGLFDQTSTGNGLIVGEQGTGTLVISNKGVVISEASNIGVAIGWNQGQGTVDLKPGGTLIGNFLQGGSGTSLINFDGGVLRAGANARLNFMTNLTLASVLSGAIIDSSNATIAINLPLVDGGLGGGLTKLGSGTLYLNGTNNYTGATVVNAGSLGGTGVIMSPVTVAAGGNLAPGVSIGTLNISNTLTLAAGSTTTMELSKNAGTSDAVAGVTTLTYGGTLVLHNLGGMLQAGDTFKLFGATTYSGSFAGVTSITPGQTVTWDTSRLGVDGTVKVTTVASAPTSVTAVTGTNGLTLSWPVTGWELQVQTNALTVGVSTNWVTIPGSAATNQMILPIDRTKGTIFYRLIFP